MKTNTFNTPGVAENEGKCVFFLKHLYHARQIRMRLLECFERAAIPLTPEHEIKRLLSFVIVGGGPTSCEFAGELHDFLKYDVSRWYPDLKESISVTLVEAGDRLMPTFNKNLSTWLMKRILKKKIDVRVHTAVTKVQ